MNLAVCAEAAKALQQTVRNTHSTQTSAYPSNGRTALSSRAPPSAAPEPIGIVQPELTPYHRKAVSQRVRHYPRRTAEAWRMAFDFPKVLWHTPSRSLFLGSAFSPISLRYGSISSSAAFASQDVALSTSVAAAALYLSMFANA